MPLIQHQQLRNPQHSRPWNWEDNTESKVSKHPIRLIRQNMVHLRHDGKRYQRLNHTVRVILGSLFIMAAGSTMLSNTELSTDRAPSYYEDSTRQLLLRTRALRERPRVVYLDDNAVEWSRHSQTSSATLVYQLVPDRNISISDITRFYANGDSADFNMERRLWPKHEFDPHCVPMDDWQNTFHPVCNDMHASGIVDNLMDQSLSLLSAKGYWRHAWRHDNNATNTTTVWKTFK